MVSMSANGDFVYDPSGVFDALDAGESAVDTFTYDIADGNGGTASATVSVTVTGVPDAEPVIVTIGNAPERVSRRDRDAWEDAWTDDMVQISHKSDYTDSGEAYSDVSFTSAGAGSLAGGDIFRGDLGVSGQSLPTSVVRQEIDGTEALRFDLAEEATEVTFGVNRLFVDDDGTGFAEAGRVQLFNAAGDLVAEEIFVADSSTGDQTVTVAADEGFTSVIFTAGLTDDDQFVFGGYATGTGEFGSGPFTDGTRERGSDYVLDFLEFTFEATPATNLDETGEQITTDGAGLTLNVLGQGTNSHEPDLG